MSEHPEKIVLAAPLSGILVPLEEVPDPVFAQKMAGDGIAIEPDEGLLVAPYDGMITQLHSASHAVTLTTPQGIEVLMHIGLETVLLKGQGFSPKVGVGDTVRAGDPLISFDLPYIREHAAGALSMMVVGNGEAVSSYLPASGEVRAGKSPVLELTLADPASLSSPSSFGEMKSADAFASGGSVQSEPILIVNPAGFHARPASVLANTAKQYAADVRIAKQGYEANAKSVMSLMTLDVQFHDRITIRASGADADMAVAALTPLIASGLGEDIHARPAGAAMPAPSPERGGQPSDAATSASAKNGHAALAPPTVQASDEPNLSGDPNLLFGVPASPGLAAGWVFQFRRSAANVTEAGRGPEVEEAALSAALTVARQELEVLQKRLRDQAEVSKAAIFFAHEELVQDPELVEAARAGIARGKSAAFAWQTAFTEQADILAGMNNELLAGRASDLRDIGRRVLRLLTGETSEDMEIPTGSVIIAEDLTPSETTALDTSKVVGFCLTKGSATSHVSLLARSAGIVAIAAVPERVLELPDGTPVLLDGGKGILRLHPGPDELLRARELQEETTRIRALESAEAGAPAVTKDGFRIKVVGNIGGVSEAEQLVAGGAEGVGLLRSEFLFLQRTTAPSEDEQAEAYVAVGRLLGPDRDLVVRTLDVGGDKPIAYLPMPTEMNPFLGVRGIRLNMLGADLLDTQVRAILRAAPYTRLHIMFPMVATVEEVREAKAITDAAKEALGVTAPVSVGIMVEVPSVALLAENLAAEADFFSIGTNDLTQYTLAVDRGHPRLARMADALHPSVLRLIAMTVEGAHKHGKWVGVCGGLASEIEAVPVLLGLGVDELSCSVASVPAVKAAVRKQNMRRCRVLAKDVLTMLTAAEVRQYLQVYYTEYDG